MCLAVCDSIAFALSRRKGHKGQERSSTGEVRSQAEQQYRYLLRFYFRMLLLKMRNEIIFILKGWALFGRATGQTNPVWDSLMISSHMYLPTVFVSINSFRTGTIIQDACIRQYISFNVSPWISISFASNSFARETRTPIQIHYKRTLATAGNNVGT